MHSLYKFSFLLSCLLSCFVFSSNAVSSYEFKVFATQQKAETILQQIKPLFVKKSPDQKVSFSAKGYQLIVKASPSIIKEIAYILKQIDKPLKNLIVEVASKKSINKQLKSNQISDRSGHSNDTYLSKNHLQAQQTQNIQYYKKSNGNNVKIISTHKNTDSMNDQIFSSRVLEGNWVSIKTGKEIPYYSGSMDVNKRQHYRNSYYAQVNTEFKSISSGFDAKITLQLKDKVLIDIHSQYQHQNKPYQNTIQTSSNQTTISGKINEWIPLSKIQHQQNQQTNNMQIAAKNSVEYSNQLNKSDSELFIRISID